MLFTHDEQALSLRVLQMVWEAEGVLSVSLGSLDGSSLPAWQPGAHLDLHFPDTITRQYSLCGRPNERGVWRIAVLREPNSRGGSSAVHEKLRPGDLVDVVGPRNNFPLVDANTYVFVAGGIGITPILPMVWAVAESKATWRLTYGGRTRKSMAFLSELARLGDQVSVRPADEHGLLDFDEAIGRPRPGAKIYCCGPEPLLTAAEKYCSDWPIDSLHVERFAVRPRETADVVAESSFEVILSGSGRRITVPVGATILEALEENGIFPPNSCREGLCGTCETNVVAGVPDHRDSVLSDEERATNSVMMICVGRALSGTIELKL